MRQYEACSTTSSSHYGMFYATSSKPDIVARGQAHRDRAEQAAMLRQPKPLEQPKGGPGPKGHGARGGWSEEDLAERCVHPCYSLRWHVL